MKNDLSVLSWLPPLAARPRCSPPSCRFRRLQFDSNADLLKFPDNIHMGEAAGVATNSKGDIFLYTRTGNPSITLGTSRAVSHGGSRLFQFDRTGKFVREIGQGAYGLLQAQQVRVDPQDNVWIVDQMSTQVIKFDPNGRVQMVLSRKPEAMRVPALPLTPLADRNPGRADATRAAAAGAEAARAAAGGPVARHPRQAPGAAAGARGGDCRRGAEGESFQRPTDVAWDAAGNIYVADGYGNARIAKYEPSGKYIKSWGSRGTAPGQFNIVHGIAIDAQGNVYVADEGNRRIQVFDGNGTFKTAVPERRHADGDLHHARAAPVPVRGAHRRSRWHGRRRDLQSGSGRENRRQVRQGRQAGEGIRPGQLDRLPQRERTADRRAQ